MHFSLKIWHLVAPIFNFPWLFRKIFSPDLSLTSQIPWLFPSFPWPVGTLDDAPLSIAGTFNRLWAFSKTDLACSVNRSKQSNLTPKNLTYLLIGSLAPSRVASGSYAASLFSVVRQRLSHFAGDNTERDCWDQAATTYNTSCALASAFAFTLG